MVAYEGLIEIIHHDLKKINVGSRNLFWWDIWAKKSYPDLFNMSIFSWRSLSIPMNEKFLISQKF